MAKKKTIKPSEARILLLINSNNEFNYAKYNYLSYLSTKLDIDYAYSSKIINNMVTKGWIEKRKIRNKTYLGFTDHTPKKEDIITALRK